MTAPNTDFTPPRENLSHEDMVERMTRAIAAERRKTPAADDPTLPETPEKPAGKGLKDVVVGTIRGAASIVTHPLQTTASMGRGLVGMVDDTAETVISLGAWLANKTPLVDEEWKRHYKELGAQGIAEAGTEFIDTARDSIFGDRSTQQSQQFVEDVAQFTAGFLGTGKIKVAGRTLAALGKSSRLAGAVIGAVRGAIVDFAAFDPYKEQLAELAARSEIAGLKDLGEMLSVTEDDGPVAARFKRSVAGLVPGVAIDGLVAAARYFKAAAVLKAGTATPAAREAAEAAIATNGKIIDDISEGTHVPNDPVIVKQSTNGRWELADNPAVLAEKEWDDLVRRHKAIQESERFIAEVEAGENTVVAQNRRIREDVEAAAAARGEAPMPHSPSFDSRWEAEGHAASINTALAARMSAGAEITADETRSILDAAQTVLDMETPEALVDAFGKMRFNFPYTDAPAKTEQLLRSINEHLSPAFDKTQGRAVISQEQSIDRALELAGMIPRSEADDYLKTTGNILKNADANLLVMNSQLVERGEQVAKWSAILDERPFDAVAEAEARRVLQSYVNLAADVAGSNSGVGRGLNALKFRGTSA